ncbi:hypothetical protein [Terriglobus roseus]|uniref:Uncharacterized protein n=1 Tax=Terriglobus roseus TaxID=392734 RepID=A0A1H4LQA5_9BACT|nr:hypothetical protein [Terriglobus roseus]SEB72969.1 hypothetical protein SAMN05443244_1681 [Terriglobus roseus]
MLSRNLYILSGTLVLFATISYVVAVTGLAHEPGAPSDASLWRTIGIVMLLLGLVIALLGVLQSMFEQADRRTPGGQAGVHREYERRRQAQKNASRPPNSGRG